MIKRLIIFFYFNLLFSQIDTTIIIDARDYNEWIYFSLRSAQIVESEDPFNSLEWDVAFQRKHIKTNSGLSGIGSGGASVDSSMIWINEWNNIENNTISHDWIDDSILNDFYDLETHTFGPGIKNSALNSWGWFDEEYQLNVNHYVLHVLTSDGENVVKFWPFNYYNNNGQGGYITFRYSGNFSINSCDYNFGDVTMDGSINVSDIISMVNFILESVTFNNCQMNIADLSNDGQVNITDIIAVVNIIID